MRLTLTWFGLEVDLYLGPSTVDDDVLDSVQDTPDTSPGSFTSCPVGFTANINPNWERPLNGWDEPSEGDEDV